MKVIILAGGLPSTLIEEDEKMPKPMAEIGPGSVFLFTELFGDVVYFRNFF